MEGGLVFQIGAWEKETEVQARGLWDVDTLHEGYDTMCQALSQSAARLSQMAPEDGAREAFLLGSQAIRQILLDPLLPAPLVEVARRRAFVEAMLEYDALGRRLWQELMPGIREGASGSGDDRMQGEAGAALGFSQEMETSGDLDAERQKAR